MFWVTLEPAHPQFPVLFTQRVYVILATTTTLFDYYYLTRWLLLLYSLAPISLYWGHCCCTILLSIYVLLFLLLQRLTQILQYLHTSSEGRIRRVLPLPSQVSENRETAIELILRLTYFLPKLESFKLITITITYFLFFSVALFIIFPDSYNVLPPNFYPFTTLD